MKKAISFQNVNKKFKNFEALQNISFDLNQGEFLALLGPNGAGKTTLINCLTGITKRSDGLILVNGRDPEKEPENTKIEIGVVEQELCFDPFFTPLEILKLRQGLFGIKEDLPYLLWILEELELLDKKDNDIHSLSGGMKRRLMIAKALAHKPQILVLDEPTAGVDIELRQKLYKFLKQLNTEKNISILLTTHYLEEAELLADRIVIQHQGKTLLTENKEKLLAQNKRTLLIEKENGDTEEIKISTTENIAEKIKSYSHIKNIKIQEPKLEEIFLHLTHKK